MEDIHDSANTTTNSDSKHQNSVTFSIASFNILAEAYLTPRSHKNLPPSSANIVFDKVLRRKLLCDTLEKLTKIFDILCLQELDDALQDVVFETLENLGYSYVYASRASGSVPIIGSSHVNSIDVAKVSIDDVRTNSEETVRSDGCATFFSKARWKCVKYSIVNFDDLAEETRPLLDDSNNVSTSSPAREDANEIDQMKKKGRSPISGIIASYKRRNAALLVELQSTTFSSANHIVVANAHLYWHPGYEYVKLSQAHYLVHKVKQFVDESAKVSQRSDNRPIVLICGDMNSKPNSVVHKYFTKGAVDARLVAPWNFSYDEMQEQQELALQMEQLSMEMNTCQDVNSCNEDLDQDPVVGVEFNSDEECSIEKQQEDMCKDETLSSLDHKDTSSSREVNDPLDVQSFGIQPTRYLLDVTLNKFSRWLRILGQDAVLESTEEEKLRTGEGKM
jgi:mRNA deadenylase 3'-5' endonuclease subunit Ccr4